MYHKVNKWHLRTCYILRQKMLPFKFGPGTQLRVLPELGAGNTPEPGMGKVCNWVPMFQRVHAVKQCNLFFQFLACPKKTFLDRLERNFQQVEVTLQAGRGTFTTWKLPTRLSF
jgi:hypothetical protein